MFKKRKVDQIKMYLGEKAPDGLALGVSGVVRGVGTPEDER